MPGGDARGGEATENLPTGSEAASQTEIAKWTNDIEMASRIEEPCQFRLTVINPEVQFVQTAPVRRVWFLVPGKKNDTTSSGRFTLKQITSAGSVVVHDNFRPDGNPLIVRPGGPLTSRPEFKARLKFNTTGEIVIARVGSTISFSGLPYQLRVVRVEEQGTVLSFVNRFGRPQSFRARPVKNVVRAIP